MRPLRRVGRWAGHRRRFITLGYQALWLGMFVIISTGCSRIDPVGRGRKMVRAELLFGAKMPGGQTVDDAEWAAFAEEYIHPKFRDGLMVFAGQGQWPTGSGGQASGPARWVVVFHADTPDAEIALFNIAQAYQRRFRVGAVLRARSPSYLRP
jgi:hypothetical protein